MIYSKAFPQLVLAVTPRKVTCNLKHPILGDTDIKTTGFQVGLAKRSNEHTWTFSGEGFIYNNVCENKILRQFFYNKKINKKKTYKIAISIHFQSHPDLFLTYLGGRFGDESSFSVNEEEGHLPGHQPFVAVCERLPTKDCRAQR